MELEAIGTLDMGSGRQFSAVRRDVRAHIAATDAGRNDEALVQELLS